MTRHTSEGPIQVPKWDVALEALVREEQQKLRRPLTLEDFRRLGRQYAIRLDDIMVTLFELVLHGRWRYEGTDHRITRELVEELTAAGRIKDEDLARFAGGWSAIE